MFGLGFFVVSFRAPLDGNQHYIIQAGGSKLYGTIDFRASEYVVNQEGPIQDYTI